MAETKKLSQVDMEILRSVDPRYFQNYLMKFYGMETFKLIMALEEDYHLTKDPIQDSLILEGKHPEIQQVCLIWNMSLFEETYSDYRLIHKTWFLNRL